MYIQSGFSLLRADIERHQASSRGRQGVQDTSISAQKEARRGAVPGRDYHGNITLEHCLEAVSDVKYITLRQIRSPRRVYKMQRHLSCCLAEEWTSESIPAIARFIDKHHTTVMYYLQREKTEKFYALFAEAKERIQKELERQERKARNV